MRATTGRWVVFGALGVFAWAAAGCADASLQSDVQRADAQLAQFERTPAAIAAPDDLRGAREAVFEAHRIVNEGGDANVAHDLLQVASKDIEHANVVAATESASSGGER